MQADKMKERIEELKSEIQVQELYYISSLAYKKYFNTLKAIKQKIRVLNDDLHIAMNSLRDSL